MIITVKKPFNQALRALCQYFKNQKHSVILCDSDSVELWGTYWDSGSRSAYYLYAPNGSAAHIPAPSAPPQFMTAAERESWDPVYQIPAGFYVVETGIFRGKKAHLVITGADAIKTFSGGNHDTDK